MIKSYIWTFVNRFLHYFLIASFSLAYLCVYFDALITFHFIFGILFGAGVLLRVIWGFVGTKYSRFSDFEFRGILSYFASILGEKKHYIGHNPASSVAIVLIFVLGLITILSGMLTIGAEEQRGIFGYLFFEYRYFEIFEDLHEFCANALLAVILIHICGSLIDKFWNKNDSIDSMISGYKRTNQEENITLSLTQKVIFGFYLAFLFVLILYLFYPRNVFLRPFEREIFASQDLKEYTKECGSCHIAYASYLLPKSSWDSMMSDLENHFGEDASLEQESQEVIAKFLQQYSSDSVDTKFSSKIAKESDSNKIAITKYHYWEVAHDKIKPALFEMEEIKSKANCQTCHKDAESGIFAKSAIDYAKLKSLKKELQDSKL
ncbi:cytochrome B [Helicobacter sp. MIT 11-5569]|uniref:cytochrome b/b6 domain-containing protein n=1 Tax=Helicobacter sp. MIT 11-5569 TaxID=1548151 RepID=UPI00068D16AB|nr:cytochrome b/b6 domain-containing protein [Helicobacter sp. MIT 11-5569]TLD85161.1 cytochrome B [Helicobacter sp. MIT 11-5569]